MPKKIESVKTGLASGCFDLFHAGHLKYLLESKEKCDFLYVAVASDSAVRALKGSGRPLTSLEDRCSILMGLTCVDAVITYRGLRIASVLETLKPSVWFKGSDHELDSIYKTERAAVKKLGIKLEFIAVKPRVSTTLTVEKLCKIALP